MMLVDVCGNKEKLDDCLMLRIIITAQCDTSQAVIKKFIRADSLQHPHKLQRTSKRARVGHPWIQRKGEYIPQNHTSHTLPVLTRLTE